MCGPFRPIGDDAGSGEVESGKHGDPPGSPLHYCGEGEGGRSWIFLSPWVTYDLPSQFTHPQELARNTVKPFCPAKDCFYKVHIMAISYVSAVSKNTVTGYHCCYIFLKCLSHLQSSFKIFWSLKTWDFLHYYHTQLKKNKCTRVCMFLQSTIKYNLKFQQIWV